MAIYRSISTTFWTDSKVSDDFTADDKYMYLYLFTNPHSNLCGCYEISYRQMAYESSLNIDKVKRIIKKLEHDHNVIRYNSQTKELLIINWHKYNWTSSEKFRKPLKREIDKIKCDLFRDYLKRVFNGEEIEFADTVSNFRDTVSNNKRYPTDTTVSVSVSDTVLVNNNKKDIFQVVPDEIKDVFMEWVAMRKAQKKPIQTERAVSMALKKLNALSNNTDRQKELISYAIYRNWLSFYPIPQGEELPKPKKVEPPPKPIDAVPMPDDTRQKMSELGYGNIIGNEKGE